MEPIFIKNSAELRKWLKTNSNKSTGTWISFTKGTNRTLTWSEIVDELLCFGWIDSTGGKVDENTSKQWISPRKSKSSWSAINKAKVEVLIKEKRMQPSGLAVIELAKQTGAWDAANDIENLVIPKDLETEFKKYKNAKTNFEAFPKSVKKAILHWLAQAKREETRLKRITTIAKEAEQNIRSNQ